MRRFLVLLSLLAAALPVIAAPAPKPRPAPVDPELLWLQSELSRLPSRAECQMWIDAAEKHLHWIEGRALLFPADRPMWELYHQQVKEWQRVWIWLREAHEAYGFVDVWFCSASLPTWERRNRLDWIRAAVGDHAYYAGYIPPPMAAHLLPRRD